MSRAQILMTSCQGHSTKLEFIRWGASDGLKAVGQRHISGLERSTDSKWEGRASDEKLGGQQNLRKESEEEQAAPAPRRRCHEEGKMWEREG